MVNKSFVDINWRARKGEGTHRTLCTSGRLVVQHFEDAHSDEVQRVLVVGELDMGHSDLLHLEDVLVELLLQSLESVKIEEWRECQ